MEQWILNGHEPVVVDMATWARWFEENDRTVAKTHIGDIFISTVFIGINHRFIGNGPPLLFETMVFGGTYDGEIERYATWDEAQAGHKRMVAKHTSDILLPY